MLTSIEEEPEMSAASIEEEPEMSAADLYKQYARETSEGGRALHGQNFREEEELKAAVVTDARPAKEEEPASEMSAAELYKQYARSARKGGRSHHADHAENLKEKKTAAAAEKKKACEQANEHSTARRRAGSTARMVIQNQAKKHMEVLGETSATRTTVPGRRWAPDWAEREGADRNTTEWEELTRTSSIVVGDEEKEEEKEEDNEEEWTPSMKCATITVQKCQHEQDMKSTSGTEYMTRSEWAAKKRQDAREAKWMKRDKAESYLTTI